MKQGREMLVVAGTVHRPSTLFHGFSNLNLNRSSSHPQPPPIVPLRVSLQSGAVAGLSYQYQKRPVPVFSGGGGSGSGGRGGGGDGREGGDELEAKRKKEAVLAVVVEDEARRGGRLLDGIPKDLAAAIESVRIQASIASKYFELEKSPLLRWLLQFAGFKERLLADDLFLTKLLMECGVGIVTKKWVQLHGFRPGQALILWKLLYANNIWAHCMDELEDFRKMLSEHVEFRALSMEDVLTASDGTRKDVADFVHTGRWAGN